MGYSIESPGANLHQPATWKRYSENMCTNCTAQCCYLVVEITTSDLIRLGFTDEDEATTDSKSLVKRLKKEGIITRCNVSKGKFTLAMRKKGGCLFLDGKNRCKVYEDRPDVCRLHPTKLSSRLGYCPWSPLHEGAA